MDLGLENRALTKETVEGLNQYLANLFVLYAKLHNYHWNVVGMNFFDIHEKTEELYEFVDAEIDRIAERVLMLGCNPVASLEEALKLTTLEEAPSVDFLSKTIAKNVIKDFTKVLKEIRRVAGIAGENKDEYTIVLLGDAIGFFEKAIWMFSAYLRV